MNQDKIQWNKGEPPKDGGTYLLMFYRGVICSGRHRLGYIGEPQQDTEGWRCDCCGNFGTPLAWSLLPQTRKVNNVRN